MKDPNYLFAIGDIHGNVRALDDLLSRILPELSPQDTLVFLGDCIDRGPNVRECVDRIVESQDSAPFTVVTLLGNHEDWMLKSYRDHTAHSWIVGMESFETIDSYSAKASDVLRREIERCGINMILGKSKLPYDVFFDSVPTRHLKFFENLQRYHRANRVLCVHGGLDMDVEELEAQHPDSFLWGGDSFPGSYSGEDYVVYGHHSNAILDSERWPHPNLKENRAYGIDTISHGVLTAMRFPGGDVFQSRRFNV